MEYPFHLPRTCVPEILLSDYVVSNDDIGICLVLPYDCSIMEQREARISCSRNFIDEDEHILDPALEALDRLDLPGDAYDVLRMKVYYAISDGIATDWPGGLIFVDIQTVRRVRFQPNQNSNVDRQVGEWIETNWSDHKPIPASKSAIHSLAKVRFESRGVVTCQGCTICMEEFEEGSEISLMPCKHVYHGECIIKWLEINHMCPLCRFPMPH